MLLTGTLTLASLELELPSRARSGCTPFWLLLRKSLAALLPRQVLARRMLCEAERVLSEAEQLHARYANQSKPRRRPGWFASKLPERSSGNLGSASAAKLLRSKSQTAGTAVPVAPNWFAFGELWQLLAPPSAEHA